MQTSVNNDRQLEFMSNPADTEMDKQTHGDKNVIFLAEIKVLVIE